MIWIVAFTVFPLLYAIYTSLYTFRFGQRFGFVGVGNFTRLFTDENLLSSLRVTLTFVVGTVTVEMVLGVALALLLSREIRGSNAMRGIATLPLFATPVAVGYLGITLAGLQGLPSELYDAARVDGAGATQSFRFLTLPLLAPLLWLILLLRLVEAFRVFDIPVSLTLGGPGRATEVYSLYTYRTALRFFDHGYSAAQGFLLLVIVMLIVSLIFSRIRGLYEEER